MRNATTIAPRGTAEAQADDASSEKVAIAPRGSG
jgi:hypothetical protein